MSLTASEARSGKGHKDENFPVASHLIHPRHRPAILAFYYFVRAGDDVADHPTLTPDEKLRLLDGLEAALLGKGSAGPEAEALRRSLAETGVTPRHAQDLLDAFRMDARVTRYRDWPALIHYCSLSAMPVGRYVLDVHSEERTTWGASDALCAALQVINHLQDCGKDYRALDRVYLPEEVCAAHGARIEDLAGSAATPGLLACIRDLNARTVDLLRESAVFPAVIADTRLGLEVAVIQGLAELLVGKLARLDPLRDKVHASKGEALGTASLSVLRALWQRRGGASARTRLGATG